MAEYEAPKRTQKNGLTPAEEKAVLEEARERMKVGLEADKDDRKRAQTEQKFVWNLDNCQWDDEAKKARAKRPMLTENRNPAFIRQATNEIRRSRPQVRILPVDNQGDPFTAQVMEGLIRNIEANSRADLAYDGAVDNAGECGRGYWKVTTEYEGEGFEQCIAVKPVPDPFAIVDDPDATMPDKSDRGWAFEVERVRRSNYQAKTGKKPFSFQEASDALGDHAADWCDENYIVIANYWRVVEDKSPIYLMTDGEVTKDPKQYVEQVMQAHAQMVAMVPPGSPPEAMPPPPEIPEVDQQREMVNRRVEWFCVDGMKAHSKGAWAGKYIPLVFTTCEQRKIDGKWRTKGMTFDAQDLTKANNYLLSAQVENIALTPKQPFIGPKGSFKSDKAKWNQVNQEPYPYIEYDIVSDDGDKPLPAPQRTPGVTAQPEIATVRAGVVDGQRSVIGLLGASLGDQGPEVAWRAVKARQSKGDTAVFHVMDNLVRAVRYGGMVILDLLPKIYNRKRVVRIINPDGEAVMQAINQAFVDKTDGQTKMVDFSSGDYDCAVTAGPAFETQRQQDNELLVELVTAFPQMATVAPDLVARRLISGTGDGEKIAQRLAKTVDPSLKGEAPPPEVKKLNDQIGQMQQALQQTTQAKDLAESELMKQKSVLEREKVKGSTDVAKLQAAVEKAHLDTEKAHIDLARKELEYAMAQAGPQLGMSMSPDGQVVHEPQPTPEPQPQEPSAAEILAPALAHMGEAIGQGLQDLAQTNQNVQGAIAQLAHASSQPKPKGRRKATLPDGRQFTVEDL